MSSSFKSLTTGVFYTAIAKYSNIVLSIIIGAILARLLTPKEFGIVALVTVFVTFFNLLGDFGLGKAVVQNQRLTKTDIQSIFSFSVVFALVLSFLFFLVSPIISTFYNTAELINVSKWLSIAVFFHTLQSIPKSLLEKSFRFKELGVITVVVELITGVIAIILAYQGFSYYSLVIRSILNGIFVFFLVFAIAPIRLAWIIDWSSVSKVIRFSVFNFGFNFINYFSRNGDNLLIGKFMGSASLGFYDKAYRLMLLPVRNLTNVITPVLMPVLSKYQNDKTIVYLLYLKIVKLLATIGFPLSVFLFFSSYEIINIIYGTQWNSSIPVFKLISLTIGIQMIYVSAPSIFQAINRTDLLFYYGLIGALVLLSGISYGVFIGKELESVGHGLLVAFFVNFFIVFFMLIKLALSNSYKKFIKTILYPLFISVGMSIPLWFYSQSHSSNIYISLGIKAIIAGTSFAFLFFLKGENRRIVSGGIKNYIKL